MKAKITATVTIELDEELNVKDQIADLNENNGEEAFTRLVEAFESPIGDATCIEEEVND